MFGPTDFVFLGKRGSLSEIGWNGEQTEKLWRYNQHYFDDLNAMDSASRAPWHRALIERWIRENPPGQGNGWEPYPTSLRIVNWIKWSLAGNSLQQEAIQSLAVQCRWLVKRLEIHLLGNHLFANAKALIFAGAFFRGAEADEWLKKGLHILSREIAEQILPDGGHFERSTMYHALALEDVLDICNLGNCYPQAFMADITNCLEILSRQAMRMHVWLQTMCHPDGEISFFNDAAIDIAPTPTELTAYLGRLGFPSAEYYRVGEDSSTLDFGDAQSVGTACGDPGSLGEGSRALMPSGYIRLCKSDAVVLLDVAPIGPDYLPGHAHADTLSFELSLGDQRVLVNSGTSRYGSDPERLRQRSTAAHNTVSVNDTDSSEVWGGFRVARRARPMNFLANKDGAGAIRVSCAHDGYRRLPGKPIHERHWILDDHGLVVDDAVSGRHNLAEAYFHFSPDVRLCPKSDCNSGEVIFPGGRRLIWSVEVGNARLEPCSYHPRFGVSLASTRLAVTLRQGRSRVQLKWSY